MIKEQLKAIKLMLIAIALLVAVCFAVTLMGGGDPGVVENSYDADGDLLGNGGRPYIYEVIDSERVASIFVKNEHGQYKMKLDPVAGEFVLEGEEQLRRDTEALSYLYVITCNTLAMAKV